MLNSAEVGKTRSPKVLVIESDPDYRAVISRCVELAGATPDTTPQLNQGVRRLESGSYDLIVWGVAAGEPDRAGTVQRLHQCGKVPLILLDESYEDARQTFEAGADQVLPKPFVPGALVGGVKAGLRGSGPTSVVPLATRIDVKGIIFDSEARTVSFSKHSASLTRREWDLLAFMLGNPGQYHTAEDLLVNAWHTNRHSAEQIRSYVARLRRKLRPLSLPMELISQQGRGYCLGFEAAGQEQPG